MSKITIEKLPEDAEPPLDLPDERVTIEIHDLPETITTLERALNYLKENPSAVPIKLLRLLELKRDHPLARKAL